MRNEQKLTAIRALITRCSRAGRGVAYRDDGHGIGAGDEVITTPFTFGLRWKRSFYSELARCLSTLKMTRAISIDSNESKISSRTKAIIPVSLYGQIADMDSINEIAGRHGLVVIEDAAQSFGASYKGRRSCNISRIACASFFPSKPLGCYGDGGAIFTSDSALAQAMREIRVHGQQSRYYHTRVGVGGRMIHFSALSSSPN